MIHKAIIYRSILIGSRTQYVKRISVPTILCIDTDIADSTYRFEDMNRLFESHQIRPVVDKVFPFEQAKQAYEYLASQKHVGKIVIKVSN